MDSGELYDLFRSDVVDTVQPYLWSDDEVWTYMNDAYVMFVRLTGGIPDSTSRVTTIPIVTGEASAQLHPSIMRIRQATLVSTNAALTVLNAQDIADLTTTDYGTIQRLGRITTPGPVRFMVIGEENQSITWIQVPERDDAVQLLVERLPLEPITGRGQDFAGVREEHHFHLMKWMRYLAYRKQDTETFDMVKSDAERKEFVDYCDLAATEKDRRRHKVRTTGYGGI